MRSLAVLLMVLAALAPAAEQRGGGGSATVSAASGDSLFAVLPAPQGVNGQLLIRRLSADGGVIWEQRWGQARGEEAVALVVTADGGAVLVGSSRDGCFALGVDGQGNVLWATDLGPARAQCRPAAVAVDAERNAYVLATGTGADGFDALVWKLDARGAQIWSYRYDRPGSVYAETINLDPRGQELRAYVQWPSANGFTEDSFRLDLDGRRLY